jgi:uncharacterized caspase-like protein
MRESFALVVGVEEYQDKIIPNVEFAGKDAYELSSSLVPLGYPIDHQFVMVNDKATKATIESKVRRLARRVEEDDNLILFYAGHGFAAQGHNYITCYDTQHDDLTNTSISLQLIFDKLLGSKCKHIVIFLDSCHSGMPINDKMRDILTDMSVQDLREFFGKSEYCVGFASCRDDEISYSSIALKHGIWTYHLIEALKGNASQVLNRDFMITGNALQAYLSTEVPKTVHKYHQLLKIQNPVLFGSMTREFAVANLRELMEARDAEANPSNQQLKRAIFISEEPERIKSLSGFIKRFHHEPDSVNDAANNFIARIAEGDIKDDIESVFGLLRKHLHYKGKELEVTYEDGVGSISTPDFDYSIRVSQNGENPSEAIWTREITDIHNIKVIGGDEFNATFNNYFDTLKIEFSKKIDITSLIDKIESNKPPGLEIDYLSDQSYCTLTMEGLEANLLVYPTFFQISHDEKKTPRLLIESFFNVYKALAIALKQDIKLLPFKKE